MKNKANFFFDNRGFPNWGERGRGGPPLGNFSHIIPFFSDDDPCTLNFRAIRIKREQESEPERVEEQAQARALSRVSQGIWRVGVRQRERDSSRRKR